MDKIMLSVQKNLPVLTYLYRFLVEAEAMDVKAKKDVAMSRFNRRRKFKWLFEATAVLFVLAQSSPYWIPIAADRLREIVPVFRSHLFVFAIFNFIILAVYALSAGILRPSSDATSEKNDSYSEFVSNSRRISAAEESPPPPSEAVVSENVGEEPKGEAENDKEKALVVVVSAKRTRWASFGMRTTTVGEESRRDFRRSYSEIRRKLTLQGEESAAAERKSSAVVNGMSDEELNQRIEAFIATQKWIQQEEYKEERNMDRFNVTLSTTTTTTVSQ